jgi:hypothetical protein
VSDDEVMVMMREMSSQVGNDNSNDDNSNDDSR